MRMLTLRSCPFFAAFHVCEANKKATMNSHILQETGKPHHKPEQKGHFKVNKILCVLWENVIELYKVR